MSEAAPAITIRTIEASGGSATAYCGNPLCYRFRHGAYRALKLAALPPDVTVDEVKQVLRCDACDKLQAEIVVAMGPGARRTLDHGQVRGLFR